MKPFKLPLAKPFLLLILLFLAGCQSIDVRGQFVSDSSIEELNNNKPDQDGVIELIGTPTYIPEYSPNHWYYIQRSMTKRAWFDPKVVEQRILKISFTDKGEFVEAALLSNIHNENIITDNNYTKTLGTEQSGVQKFVKNIGRFNKTSDGKKKGQKKK